MRSMFWRAQSEWDEYRDGIRLTFFVSIKVVAMLTIGMADTFRPYIDRGELVPVLEDFLPAFPGFFLYFPSRRNQPRKLRALIEHVRSPG